MAVESSAASQLSFSIENILREDFPPRSRIRRLPVHYASSGRTERSRIWLPYGNYANNIAIYPYWPICYTRFINLTQYRELGRNVDTTEEICDCDELTKESANIENEENANDTSSIASGENLISQEESTTAHRPVSPSRDITETAEEQGAKKKRCRSHFTELQLKYMETYFSHNQYLSRDERTVLAKALDMTELQMRNWFQNKRYQRKHREDPTASETKTD